jgi:uncharacterized protein GlcG (DUF336 family)
MKAFLQYKTLSLKVADEIATLAIQTCLKSGFKPVAVCVMDQAGYPIVAKRADGCTVSILNSGTADVCSIDRASL